jgi:hypothetical protein
MDAGSKIRTHFVRTPFVRTNFFVFVRLQFIFFYLSDYTFFDFVRPNKLFLSLSDRTFSVLVRLADLSRTFVRSDSRINFSQTFGPARVWGSHPGDLLFSKAQSPNCNLCTRGRCYDNNFQRFFLIFGEKIGVFLKNQCYDHNFCKN